MCNCKKPLKTSVHAHSLAVNIVIQFCASWCLSCVVTSAEFCASQCSSCVATSAQFFASRCSRCVATLCTQGSSRVAMGTKMCVVMRTKKCVVTRSTFCGVYWTCRTPGWSCEGRSVVNGLSDAHIGSQGTLYLQGDPHGFLCETSHIKDT